jgi:sarcosine oxidase
LPAYDVAVVGLGAMGAATLHDLARRGRRTIGLERFEPGHDRGSSHGESRLIRLAYFEDPAYVPLVRLAYRNWRALEAATGARLLTVTGMLEAGRAGSPIVQGSLRSAREHGLAHEQLTAAQIAARFPAFALPADWEGLFQPDGGVLQPEAAVRLYVRTAQALGAVVRTNTRVLGVAPTAAGGVRLDLGGGETIEAGSVVVAAGPWIGELAPALAPHLRLTRQVLAWFQPSAPALTGPKRFPGFLLETPDDVIYGFPDFLGTGVKAASHNASGELAAADDARAPAAAADIDRILRPLQRFIPAAAGPVIRTDTCVYTRTVHEGDEHFILGPHTQWPQIVLASPCSGHGFKFASIIGEILADLALTGTTDKPIDRFSPARFGA